MRTAIPQTQPTGAKLMHLRDVPLDTRLAALHHLMRHDNLGSEDIIALLDKCLDPGDTSTRIAA